MIDRIDLDSWGEALIGDFVREQFVTNSAVYAQFWPGNAEKTCSKVRQLLLQQGMSSVGPGDRRLSRDWVEELSSLRARDARERFAPSSDETQ